MRIEHWLYSLPLRLRSLFRRKQVEQELDEELHYHLELKIEEYVSRGLSAEEARYTALREMDGVAQRKEECRDARGVNAIEDTVRDIRYSLRILANSRVFTLVTVVTLALAICANAVVFGIFNALILRPLDLPQADRLYTIERASDHNPPESYPNYLDIRDRNRSFDALEADTAAQAALDTGHNASSAWLLAVSGNYFDVLGIRPHLGRVFHGSDEHGPNSAPYIVLSYAYWHSRFQDDRAVVGRTVQLNKHPFTIVGVAPPGFHGTVLFFYPDFFIPIVNQPQVGTSVVRTDVSRSSLLTARGNRSVTVTGHLKPGVTPAQAIADLNSIGAWLEKTYPGDEGKMAFVLARPGLFGDTAGVRYAHSSRD